MGAVLGEHDLLDIADGCRIDKATIRGFCVERDSYFRLAPISIGHAAVINTYTQIAPGSNIEASTVIGPHASSFDPPSIPSTGVGCNRTMIHEPPPWMKLLVAWPIIAIVLFISHIPWLLTIYCMVENTDIQQQGLNSVESVVVWFATPRRIAFHILSRVFRDVLRPFVQLMCGIMVKRLMGMNKPGDTSQWCLLRRYTNQILLSQHVLRRVGDVLGTHYETTSVSSLQSSIIKITHHNIRSYGELWAQRSENGCIGQDLASTVQIQSSWKSETTLSSVHVQSSSPRIASDPRR